MRHDVFLSHSSADKAVARALLKKLEEHEYRFRLLRLWFDEEQLDPGLPASKRELETALERSRFLVLLATKASMNSPWVQSEIEYFLRRSRVEDVVLLMHEPCEIPDSLAKAVRIPWNDSKFGELLNKICPVPDGDTSGDLKAARRSIEGLAYQRGNGFNVEHMEEDEDLLRNLLEFDIGDLDDEGMARKRLHDLAFNFMDLDRSSYYSAALVFGELLALLFLHSPAYRQEAHGLLEYERELRNGRERHIHHRRRTHNPRLYAGVSTNLAFAFIRAQSKIAEVDPLSVDLSLLWDVLLLLDQDEADGPAKALAVMASRVLGKTRAAPACELLIATLSRSDGWASKLCAAWSISGMEDESGFVYSTARMQKLVDATKRAPSVPPSHFLQAVFSSYSALRSDLDPDIEKAREEYCRLFGEPDGSADGLGSAPKPIAVHNRPIVGVVRKVTLENMEDMAKELGPSDIAWLTEERIVESLFDMVGALLIADQPEDTPLRVRLRSSNARHAVYSGEAMERIVEGAALALYPDNRLGYVRS